MSPSANRVHQTSRATSCCYDISATSIRLQFIAMLFISIFYHEYWCHQAVRIVLADKVAISCVVHLRNTAGVYPPPNLVFTATCLFLLLLHIMRYRGYNPPPTRLDWDRGVLFCDMRKVRARPLRVSPIAICLSILQVCLSTGDFCLYAETHYIRLAWRTRLLCISPYPPR